MILLVGMLLIPTFLCAAPDYIVIRIYSSGDGSCIVVSPEEAKKQQIEHLPKGTVINYDSLKKDYEITKGVYGMSIDEKDIPKYIQTIAGK